MSESVPCIQDAKMPEQMTRLPQPEMNIEPVQAEANRQRSLSTAPDLAVDHPRSHKETTQTMASVHEKCSSRLRPSLQNLPLELLERIFLYSTNFALPRSNPLLGAKLSAKVTLLRLFMVGFHDTWDQLFGVTRHQLKKLTLRVGRRFEGDSSLQSDLLSLPWVDIDFILEAQQMWADKYARGRRYRHYEYDASATLDQYYVKNDALDRYLQHIREHKEKTWKFDARSCFEADYERACKIPLTLVNSIYGCCLRGSPEIHPLVRPPPDIVTGPWNEEKKRRLFWLVRAGLDPTRAFNTNRPDWKLRLAYLDATVIYAKEPDPLLTICLIGRWIYFNFPRHVDHKRFVDVRRRINRGGDTEEVREILRFLDNSMNDVRQSTEQ
ncbi:hypothetical protein E4U12_002607 [Claviceps purpurea]|nr:hypothetical protein E4U12_002607 [Claviceps purpurea]